MFGINTSSDISKLLYVVKGICRVVESNTKALILV